MKNCLFRVLLFIIAIFCSFLILESTVLLFLGEQAKFPRHVVGSTFGIRINEPFSKYRHKSADVLVWFDINKQGMRANHDYSYEKPDEVKRIISLGDSFTIGYEVSFKDCFSSITENYLKNKGYNVEVLNAGVSGFSSAEEYLYLKRELLKYDPDLVLISFYSNDIVDNFRTNIFRLAGNRLVEEKKDYIPMGRIGNFLNTSWFFNLLSERSNAFVFFKERLTALLKERIVQGNIQNMDAEKEEKEEKELLIYANKLTAAIYEKIYKITFDLNIPLIIQSIPLHGEDKKNPDNLQDLFPLQYFNVNRPGIFYLSAKRILDPYVSKKQLYWMRSHGHWTPFSNKIAGEAIADIIVKNNLL